jgi:hypothetical protein
MSLIEVPERFTDVDFRRAAPAGKVLGCCYESREMMAAATPGVGRFSNRLVDPSLWSSTAESLHDELSDNVQYVHDQDGIGQCVADATTFCIEYRAYQCLGKENFRKLSASHLYCRIGTSDESGAYVSDGAKYSEEQGCVPLDGEEGYEYTYKAVGYDRNLPGGWEKTALLFTARWERVEGRQEIYSAQWQGKPIIVGRNGHSIGYFDPQPDIDGNDYCNSWGNWGSPINSRIPYGRGRDTGRKMALVGYACVDVAYRSEVPLP